ncbi:hypothetical protein EAH_00067820, partial [Eimeria acervulina]
TTEGLRRSLKLTSGEGAYSMLRPADSHNFLQKLFYKEQNTAHLSGVDDAEGNAWVPPEVDQENFELMMKGFQLAEFSTSEITELLQLLAGLLNLSNVSLIRGDGDVLQVQDADAHEALKNAAFLLGIEEEELERLLQCRLLDIYGFESFGLENGLEQLCINYANERQQQLFVQQVIEEEVALYTREGVTSPAVTARNKLAHRRQNVEHETEQQPSGERMKPQGSFRADLELSLLS